MFRRAHATCWLLGLGLVLMPNAEAADLVAYHDGLADGWQNWSWNTSVNFSSAAQAFGGTGTSIAATFNSAWAGLYLHTDNVLSATDYTAVRFVVHGGSGGQQVRFVAYDGGGAQSDDVALAPLPNTWTTVEVPLATLGVGTVSGIVWQDTSGGSQPTFYVDEIVFVDGGTPPGAGPALAVDVSQDRHAISPYVYGMNFASPALLSELRVPVHRWGGNATTRYNWQNDTSNRAGDWYFENIPNDNPNPQLLPVGSSSDRFIADNIAAGADTLLTVPLIGWTPKERAFDCGFRVSLYGAQQSTDPWQPDCGNGVAPGGSDITGNNPQDTSAAIGPDFVQGWMLHLTNQFGAAMNGGVRFYDLDNEPMLWNSTHRDVHPTPCSYDELRDRTSAYAAAIKAVDPAALTCGPALWGWSAYFYSALDVAAGGSWWNTRPDRMAHGDVPFVAWYLQQMHAYELSYGVRLLDYLDLHYYPQAAGVSLQGAGDAATQARRLRTTRSLWDATYTDESWIGEPVQLIPRMRAWVTANYLGTKLAISEYNWGAYDHINGALAQADVLGIFGREGLDLATLWTAPDADEPVAFAFRMLRNYDGTGQGFGETSVRATSADQGRVAVYAAERVDAALTLLLINKQTQAQACALSVAGLGSTAVTAEAYQYSAADLEHIVSLAALPFTAARSDGALQPAGGTLYLPASSLTLLVLRAGAGRGDTNCDGSVNFQDIDPFVTALSGSNTYAIQYPQCRWVHADFDCDGSITFSDIDGFVACLGGACACEQ